MSEAGALLRQADVGRNHLHGPSCQPRITSTVGARNGRMSGAGALLRQADIGGSFLTWVLLLAEDHAYCGSGKREDV